MAEVEKAPVLYRRVYVDLPMATAEKLADKARELKMTNKALMEKLVLDFTGAISQSKKRGKK